MSEQEVGYESKPKRTRSYFMRYYLLLVVRVRELKSLPRDYSP